MVALGKRLLIEGVGTAWLVFIGCGSLVLNTGAIQQDCGVLEVSLAFGLALAIARYVLGGSSGAHFNPAVTVGFTVVHRFPVGDDLLPYIAAQILGATVTAALLLCLVSGRLGFQLGVSEFAVNGFGDHSPADYALRSAWMTESVLTFAFVMTSLLMAHRRKLQRVAPLALGVCLTLIYLVSIPVTNGSINPARSTAQALFVGDWALDQLWLFWAAPMSGTIAAGMLFSLLQHFLRVAISSEGCAMRFLPPPNFQECLALILRAFRFKRACLFVLLCWTAAQALAAAQLFSLHPGSATTNPFPSTLTVGVLANGWPPFDSLQGERVTGMSADYLHALVGPNVDIQTKVFADMPHLLAAACAGHVDLLMSVACTPERERCVNFTVPYFRASVSVVVRDDSHEFESPTQLASAHIAVEKSFALECSMRERFPRARIITYRTTHEALSAVVHGDADAYLGFTPTVRYALSSEPLQTLRIAVEQSWRTSELRFAMPRNLVALRDQLNLALSSLNPAEEVAIRARWLTDNFEKTSAPAVSRTAPAAPEQAFPKSPASSAEPATVNTPASGTWSVTAVRLLPLLIGIGFVLLVTLHAYLLLQREMRLRKRTEQQLALQLNFQETMMKMVPYPLVTKDLEGRYIAINRA
ncbi:MAG: Aquaporin Z [uncultured Paraburkholderia sp.]|nr:MAG: Aquaporin Z [uncultured Paraburkholderia sp.]CAH2930428.1 MAG: Aquaporin Z [uncultured Paraburkholderia sp.]